MSDMFRIDVRMCAMGLAASRNRAQSLISAGLVYVNGNCVTKNSLSVSDMDVIEVRGEVCPYVSRGGLKLEKALSEFGIDVKESICVDIGASTGGFTDVLLSNNAARVYAIDVGTSQLDAKLRTDRRVICMENTNARYLEPEMFEELPDTAVMDVSFISIRLILGTLKRIMRGNARLISLIKPQFEAGKKAVGKKGIVSKAQIHEKVLKEIRDSAPLLGWRLKRITYSPITGSDGNIEFLGYFESAETCLKQIDDNEIRLCVKEAHGKL